jgi:SAM-dependent methyltransferase
VNENIENLVSRVVDPADHMFNTDPDWYFRTGSAGLETIHGILTLSKSTTVRTILDLPSGHGRVARYLRAAFPDAAMTFCDLDERGAAFCAREFRGEVQACDPEMSNISFKNSFDLVWVGSLFTHVDFDRTQRWLRHLCAALAPDGILVATFHGRWSIEVNKRFPFINGAAWEIIVKGYRSSGYGYSPYTPTEDIGVSLSKPSKIIEISEGIEGVRLLCYQERGWGNNHDVLALRKQDRLEYA